MAGRKKPTHSLCLVRKDETGGKFHQVGAGWKNEKGAISLALNAGVTLSWRDLEEHALYVFENTEQER
jgi:hypothetical protein